MKGLKRTAVCFLAGIILLMTAIPVSAADTVYSTATPDQWMPQRYTGFSYQHNPMLIEKAAKDIVINPDAIYGYSPDPGSDRLGEFASCDWSDPLVVWKARQERIEYLKQDTVLINMYAQMVSQGKSIEEIAREISRMRNVIRLQSYENDPVGLGKLKASNLKTYGNEEGPTADSLYKKHGSWERVLQKAFSTNMGMDACLGLFDDNYPRYVLLGEVPSKEGTAVKQDSGMAALDRIRQRGVLKVGTAGDYQPMSYLDPKTNTYVGFDACLAEDLAKSLGVKVEYVKTSWSALMEDTLAGKFDVAICGITVTDVRKKQALMSDGYLKNGKTVLCRIEDADKYTSLEAINRPEVRVMENPGGLNEKFARENLPDSTLIIHNVNQEIPGLVASGKADVMITEIMEAGFYVGQDRRLAAPLIYEPFTSGQLGVLMPKGSEDLLSYVNVFLKNEKASGRLDDMAEKYIYKFIDKKLDKAA